MSVDGPASGRTRGLEPVVRHGLGAPTAPFPAAGKPDRIPMETLRRLHRATFEDRARILALLERVRRDGRTLQGGINRRSAPQTARIETIVAERSRLRTQHFEPRVGAQLLLNFEVGGARYFFSATTLAVEEDGWLRQLLVLGKRASEKEKIEHLLLLALNDIAATLAAVGRSLLGRTAEASPQQIDRDSQFVSGLSSIAVAKYAVRDRFEQRGDLLRSLRLLAWFAGDIRWGQSAELEDDGIGGVLDRLA